MRSRVSVAMIVFPLLGLSACRSNPQVSNPQVFIGTYDLVNASDCRNDIREATLVIRKDGTYDEQVHLTTGQVESVRNERWEYDSRMMKIRFAKLFVSPQTSFDVAATHPVFILVNP